MKNGKFCLLFALILFPLAGVAGDSLRVRVDSVLSAVRAARGEEKLELYCEAQSEVEALYDPEADRSFYDEYLQAARRQKNVEHETIALLNKIVTEYNYGFFDKVIEDSPAALEFLKRHDLKEEYYRLLRLKVQALIDTGRYETAVTEANAMYAEANGDGEMIGVGYAAYLLGVIYGHMDRSDDAASSYRKAIDAFSSVGFNHGIESSYWRLMSSLIVAERYEEAVRAGDEFEAFMAGYKEDILEGGYDMFLYCCTRAEVEAAVGRFDRAEYYLGRAVEMSSGWGYGRLEAFILSARAAIDESKGDYDSAVDNLRKVRDMVVEMSGIAAADGKLGQQIADNLYKGGRHREAAEVLLRVVEVKDSLNSQEFNARLDELRTVYELDRITAQKKRARMIMFVAVGGCLLLLILLAIWMAYSRKLASKNRYLAAQVSDWARRSEAYKARDTGDAGSERQDEELMARVVEYVRDEEGFRESGLTLGMLSEKLSVNRSYVSRAVNAVAGQSFTAWLNEIRIKEAVRLMDANGHKRYSIDEFAIMSGFNNRSTFYRSFLKVTGISPSDYMRNTAVRLQND